MTAPDGTEGRRIAELTGDEQARDERPQQDHPGDHASYTRLKDHAIIGTIESVRPASPPPGWTMTIDGKDFTLADQQQVLIWLTAVDAVFALLDRQMNGHGDWPVWLYWVIRSERGPR